MAAMLVVTAGPDLANGPTTKDECKEAKPVIKEDNPFFSPLKHFNQGQCIQSI
jgi:hypothetical protein